MEDQGIKLGADFEDSVFYARHHARFHKEGTIYHVLSRTFQGTGILRPSEDTNACIAGVLARALELNPSVRIYCHAFMSNHFHLMLSGLPKEIPAFVGYLKKEISRRLGVEHDWPDTMWSQPYASTALIAHEDQVRCLKYILSQGVKEGLVERPEQWPGLHSAKTRCGANLVQGWWLDGTRLAKARYRERLKSPEARSTIHPREFRVTCFWRETRLPRWESLDARAHAKLIDSLCEEVVAEGEQSRSGEPPLGADKVLATSTRRRWKRPSLPFYQMRRKMICWAQTCCAAVREYLREYWQFQRLFRHAASEFAERTTTPFPPNAFLPGGIVGS